MKAIENCIRRVTPGKYMNSKEFINRYNHLIIAINNSSWSTFINNSFHWKQDDPEYIPNIIERVDFWCKIANS